MKTAIVHDWLITLGGAEKVLDAMLKLYPSPIYTLLHREELFDNQEVITSFLQNLPLSQRLYRNLLPLFPAAIERFDLSAYDLILSSSHAVAKGIKKHPKQLHICYCHTPMRYVWDLYEEYLAEINILKKLIAKPFLNYLKKWDTNSLNRVDYFIANSKYIAERIKRNYGRTAEVIYPPVATHLFKAGQKRERFYLTLARLVPYKKIDLIVSTFNELPHLKLVVIGDGPELQNLKSIAKKNIELLGWQPDHVVQAYLEQAKGFVFAADEDFGISMVEAQAAGTPVIAFGRGGSLEIVSPKTGIFFDEQSIPSLTDAILRFERMNFDPFVIKDHSEQFSLQRFNREYSSFIEQKLKIKMDR